MKHKLSDIFKTNNIESKRRILNRFELTKEDKADIINMSGKSNGGVAVLLNFIIIDLIVMLQYKNLKILAKMMNI